MRDPFWQYYYAGIIIGVSVVKCYALIKAGDVSRDSGAGQSVYAHRIVRVKTCSRLDLDSSSLQGSSYGSIKLGPKYIHI